MKNQVICEERNPRPKGDKISKKTPIYYFVKKKETEISLLKVE